jgi:hypothetical protein
MERSCIGLNGMAQPLPLLANSAAAPATLPKSQTFSGRVIIPPISAAVTGTGKSSVFRHTIPRAGFPYVLAESGVRWRARAKSRPAECQI